MESFRDLGALERSVPNQVNTGRYRLNFLYAEGVCRGRMSEGV